MKDHPSRTDETYVDEPFTQSLLPGETAADGEGTGTEALPKWDRYEVLERLGAGANGVVYKAYDPPLRRLVAIKLLRAPGGSSAARFVREAQAQARVDHPNVCKVYEAGELGGRPYIAMQFVAGRTLGAIAAELPLTARAALVKEAAEAVHAAHERGLVHRDLKPDNVVVEEGERGLRPFVMDFGLAREIAAAGPTLTGAIVGTPHYMAPEQARGGRRELDARTDVFSLGSTLYAVLAGRPPFAGDSTLEVLRRVIDEEPPPLRKLAPEVPKDLEAIVMKCLEKEPARRYPSARALAQDLGRFLGGEPISVRPPGLFARAARRVRKHRALAAVAAAAALGVGALAGAVVHERRSAGEREVRSLALAQEQALKLGQEVQRIERQLRILHAMPLHDVRAEHAEVRAGMRAIEEAMRRFGPVLEGSGHHALGAAYLAFDERERAREELERAWQSGYRTPETARLLGRAYGELYRQELEALRLLPGKKKKQARREEIERTLRDPALRFLGLHEGGGAPGGPGEAALDAARLALYEGRYEAALEQARVAFAGAPSLYEAKQLEGRIEMIRGQDAHERGEREAAHRAFGAAGEAFARALAIAPSDYSVHLDECSRRRNVVTMQMEDGSEGFDEALAAAAVPCEDALRVNPGASLPYSHLAAEQFYASEHDLQRGRDPLPRSAKAAALAEKAVARDPKNLMALELIANAEGQVADYQASHGVDPRPALERAIAAARKAVSTRPSPIAYNTLGLLYQGRYMYEGAHGLDPAASFDLAAATFLHAIEQNGSFHQAFNNLGNTHMGRAEHALRHGADPGPFADLAIQSYETALRLNPSMSTTPLNLGFAHFLKAAYRAAKGLDPGEAAERAAAGYRTSLERDPELWVACVNLAELRELEALHLLRRGADPAKPVAEARAHAIKAAAMAAGEHYPALRRARIEILQGRWAMREKRSPAAALAAADEAAARALQLNADCAECLVAAADALRWRAQWRLERGERPAAEIRRGGELVERALRVNPGFAEALALRGALALLGAQAGADRRSEALRAAESDLAGALHDNGLLEIDYGPLLAEARAAAR